MGLHSWCRRIMMLLAAVLMCGAGFANEGLFGHARALQREGKYDEAIVAFKNYLLQQADGDDFAGQQVFLYTEALVQLMNTYQSKGEPEACILALRELFNASPILQGKCLRDYYSVMGYALSRTERMKEAEETMMRALALPLYDATPERYFRDYAYAAAVFYSNPDYQDKVIDWCKAALSCAGECKNTSGKQWAMAMLGSLYKRSGQLNKALDLFVQSKEEAQLRNDELGMLNSLNSLIDLFLYWDIPEYANLYATEAIEVERGMTMENPMVSAQVYINKGKALNQLGETDSVYCYLEQARELCLSLPYNSGMVDVELLHGTLLTENGGDSLHAGIQELLHVAEKATAFNRANAYHQLARVYIRSGNDDVAEAVLDSVYSLLNHGDVPICINLDYELILSHYLKKRNMDKATLYAGMMFREHQAFKEKKLNFNLIETIVDLQTERKAQDSKIVQLTLAYKRLWLIVCIVVFVIAISGMGAYLFYQKKRFATQMSRAAEEVASLVEMLNESNAEKEMRAQEIKDFLKNKDNRQELETLTPTILKTDGELKFRQCFELLYPLFLHRLREKVPAVTRREELLSMLIVLKQDNKRIAELLAVAPRSVLMLRHRFRQKIGLESEYSLENFVEDILA